MHYYPLGVLVISWVFWTWETYLDFRQFKLYKTTTKVPKELDGLIDDETFNKAKAYSIDKARFGFISSIFSQIQSTVILYFFLMPYFWNLSRDIMTQTFGTTQSTTVEWEIFQSIVFTFITSFGTTFINLPLSIYNTFVIEQKHGFNKQTARFYAWDKFKQFFISFLITTPIMSAIIYIVRNGGPYFFLYLWIFCFVVILVITFFHGEIAALFDKFTPLPEGELRDKIEELSKGVNFPLTNIFVVEGSKRSAHSNAYQSGIFNRKRIVIYDTLIEGYHDKPEQKEKSTELDEARKESAKEGTGADKKKKGCNTEEILAVLCHELGHWYCSHLIKQLTFAEINYFLMFVIFSRFYNDPTFYAAFGFTETPAIIGLALMMMVLAPYNELIGFISTTMSRRFEYQSDAFAKKKGYAEKLKTALVKLNIDNLGFPVHDELYSKFNHSHPTLIQRLKALDKVD